jgi:hypothetical protein
MPKLAFSKYQKRLVTGKHLTLGIKEQLRKEMNGTYMFKNTVDQQIKRSPLMLMP